MALLLASAGSGLFAPLAWTRMGCKGLSGPQGSANRLVNMMVTHASANPNLRWRAMSDKTGRFARNWTSERDRMIPLSVKGRMFMPMADRSFRALAGV